jgi:hypothetical protein
MKLLTKRTGPKMIIETIGLFIFALLATALAKKARELRLYRKSAEAALARFRQLECLKHDQFASTLAF